MPIETVSRMLGHSNIQTTERYAHVTPKKLFDEFEPVSYTHLSPIRQRATEKLAQLRQNTAR